MAIVAAAVIATGQAKAQHKSALAVHKLDLATSRAEISQTIAALANACAKAIAHVCDRLKDRDTIHNAAEGLYPTGIGEVKRLHEYLAAIPLHELPHFLVADTLVFGSAVLQFRDKVEMALRLHRQMDAGMFDDFFQTTSLLRGVARETADKLLQQAKQLQGVANEHAI